MANKRRSTLADKLSSGAAQAPGWRDVVSTGNDPDPGAPATKEVESESSSYHRKTYLLTPELIDRVSALAEREGVGINELVRYLFTYALDEIESGRHELPTRSAGRRTIVT